MRGYDRGVRLGLIFMLVLGAYVALVAANAAGRETSDEAPAGARFSLHGRGGEDGSHLSVELLPGQTADLDVIIGNRDSRHLMLRTYAADAYTLVNGGFGVRSESEPITEPTSWLVYPAETYDLQPGATIERVVGVTVPPDTPPGVYLAGIVVETAEPIALEGAAIFNQVIRKAIGVTVIVPGPMVGEGTVGMPMIEGDTSSAWLMVPIENTGNVSLRPQGELVMSRGHRVVLTAPITMRPVYAGDQTLIEIGLPTQLEAGEYTVSLELTDEDRGWGASLDDVPVNLSPPAEPAIAAPVEISSATLRVVPDGTGLAPQYADLHVEVANRGQRIASSRLTLIVSRDGQVVEDVVLSESLALLEETTVVSRPYIPESGWQEGTYTFSLLLESVDPDSGARTALASVDIGGEVVVGA